MKRVFSILGVVTLSNFLFGQVHKMNAVDYYHNIPDSLVPTSLIIIPSGETKGEMDTVEVKWQLRLWRETPIALYEKVDISNDSLYFIFTGEMAGIAYQECKLFEGKDSIIYLGLTNHFTEIEVGIYLTTFYKISGNNYSKVDILPKLTFKDYIKNDSIITELQKCRLTKYLKINYQFQSNSNEIKAILSLRHGKVLDEMKFNENEKDINPMDEDFWKFNDLLKKGITNEEIILIWNKDEERFIYK